MVPVYAKNMIFNVFIPYKASSFTYLPVIPQTWAVDPHSFFADPHSFFCGSGSISFSECVYGFS